MTRGNHTIAYIAGATASSTGFPVKRPTGATYPGASMLGPSDAFVVRCQCCTGLVGNVDNDPAEGIDISDLSALIDYLFTTFTTPACFDETNIDGQASIDIGDLSRLIDFLYVSFNPLPQCP